MYSPNIRHHNGSFWNHVAINGDILCGPVIKCSWGSFAAPADHNSVSEGNRTVPTSLRFKDATLWCTFHLRNTASNFSLLTHPLGRPTGLIGAYRCDSQIDAIVNGILLRSAQTGVLSFPITSSISLWILFCTLSGWSAQWRRVHITMLAGFTPAVMNVSETPIAASTESRKNNRIQKVNSPPISIQFSGKRKACHIFLNEPSGFHLSSESE